MSVSTHPPHRTGFHPHAVDAIGHAAHHLCERLRNRVLALALAHHGEDVCTDHLVEHLASEGHRLCPRRVWQTLVDAYREAEQRRLAMRLHIEHTLREDARIPRENREERAQ